MDEFKVITYRHHYDLHKAIRGKEIEARRIVSLHWFPYFLSPSARA
jgi:hypothetical protein